MLKSVIQKAIASSRVTGVRVPSTSIFAFSTLRVAPISTISTVSKISTPQWFATQTIRSFSTDEEEGQLRRRRRFPPITTATLLVRGLPWERHTVNDVKKLFHDFDVADVTVFQEGGKPTGFILVTFGSIEEAKKAIRTAKNITVDEREVYCRPLNEEEIVSLKEDHSRPSNFVTVRRLPFSASEEEVKQIFSDLNVTSVALSEGNAFVQFASADDVPKALEKNGTDFARKKLLVHRTTGFDFRKASANPSRIIKVRGAHSSATDEDIKQFFGDFQVVNVTFTTRENTTGRKVPGDIFVEFATAQEAAEALKLDRQHLGERFLQIFRSSKKERRGRLFGWGPNAGQNPGQGLPQQEKQADEE